MGLCGTLIKYFIVLFNFIFVLCGIALIVVGSLLLTDAAGFSAIADQVDTSLKAPFIVLIVIGSLVFFIAFLGCCGAIKDNKCMLITFGACLVVIFIIQLVIGIYAVVTFSETDTVRSTLTKIFNQRTDESMATFGALQNSLECCGLDGAYDYKKDGHNWPVPDTCCKYQSCRDNAYWLTGCVPAFQDWISKAGKYLGGVAIGLSVVELFGALLAVYAVKYGSVFHGALFQRGKE